MIRVDIDETFPITVSLIDDNTGQLVSDQTVYYDIRDLYDNPLVPAISGTLTESSIQNGIYRTTVSISNSGSFICYATCSGFITNTEDIQVNPENIYVLTKQNRHYNISVEDVLRTTASGTISQTIRKVPYNKTDYLVTNIKLDDASDWNGTVASGIVYAWYNSTTDNVPYKMGGDGV